VHTAAPLIQTFSYHFHLSVSVANIRINFYPARNLWETYKKDPKERMDEVKIRLHLGKTQIKFGFLNHLGQEL
jgi:hypothetical protein